jgi:restriction endonuclease S subunit
MDDFAHNYLLWGIDGNFDFSIKVKGEKFATTDHCGSIKILDDRILPEYLLQELMVKKYELSYDRSLRSSMANMRDIIVTIPTDTNGNFDIEEQRKLTVEHEKLRKLIQPINSKLSMLRNCLIDFKAPVQTARVDLSTLFDYERGYSKYTHKFILQHKGDYPVYSSQTAKNGIIGYIDSFDYDKECLTWTMDGAEAGTVFLRKKGKFSMTDHCGALFLKPEYQNQIDFEYVFYELRPKLRKKSIGEGKCRVKINVLEKMAINVPVDGKGEYDINLQRDIAAKRRKVYQTKEQIVDSLTEIARATISLE